MNERGKIIFNCVDRKSMVKAILNEIEKKTSREKKNRKKYEAEKLFDIAVAKLMLIRRKNRGRIK